MNYQVGDRVRYIKDIDGDNGKVKIGWVGTIVKIGTTHYGGEPTYRLFIDWDDLINGHDCSRFAREGHGWNVWNKAVEPFDAQTQPLFGRLL